MNSARFFTYFLILMLVLAIFFPVTHTAYESFKIGKKDRACIMTKGQVCR